MTALTAETESTGPSTAAIFSDNLRDNAKGPLRTLGRTFQLAVHGVAQMLLDIGRWQLKVKETLIQAWYLVSVTALPAFLMAIPFGVIVTIQIGNVINQLGAQSLLGAGSGFAVIQQAAPLASGMLLGGAGASAIAADLGARNVREEIDAMRTMGIDPIQRLVVPRIIASVVVAPLLALFIILVGLLRRSPRSGRGCGFVLAVVRRVRVGAGRGPGHAQGRHLRLHDRGDRLPARVGGQGRPQGRCRRSECHGCRVHGRDHHREHDHHPDLHGVLPHAARLTAFPV